MLPELNNELFIMKLLAYHLMCSDNDSYMNPEMYEVNICDCLDYVKNRELHINPNFNLTKKNFDISYTYDDYLIVSERFKSFCEEYKYEGIRFYKIASKKIFYMMLVDNIIKFDSTRSQTKFLELNTECNEYNEVVGASPICLVENKILQNGFYRTDLEFGRSYAKGYCIVIGLETAEKIKEQKFKGIYLEKVLEKYKWEK